MGFPWVFYGFSMIFYGFSRVFYGFSMIFYGFSRVYHGLSMIFDGLFYGFSTKTPKGAMFFGWFYATKSLHPKHGTDLGVLVEGLGRPNGYEKNISRSLPRC